MAQTQRREEILPGGIRESLILDRVFKLGVAKEIKKKSFRHMEVKKTDMLERRKHSNQRY